MKTSTQKMKNKQINLTPQKLISSGVLLVLLLLTACSANRWHPVSKEDYSVDKKWAVLANDSLVIAVSPTRFKDSDVDLDNRFFSIYLKVRNLSQRSISLWDYGYSIISDGRQYDPIPLEHVLGSLRMNQALYQSVDIFDTIVFDQDPSETEKYDDAYFSILNSYFNASKLLPGGTKEGYLFYDRAINSKKHLMIELGDVMVEFQK